MPKKIKKQMKQMKKRAAAQVAQSDVLDMIGKNAAHYGVPAAAVLGAGAATVTGVLMRERIAKMVQTAVEEGVTMTKHLSFAKILSAAGLRRRPSMLARTAPAAGALAVGIFAGAALTFWLAPKTRAGSSSTVSPSPANEASTNTAFPHANHAPV